MSSTTSRPEREPGTHGRPRLLTHQAIIEAALELGLEDLTMKRLADHLGVGTATLYQYWSNRKELVQAAAVHALSDIEWPADTGQHWSVFAWQFTSRVQQWLAQSPSLVLSNHAREYGYEVQFHLVEQFLEVLHDRGFSPREGMEVYNIVGLMAFGGAVEAVRQADFKMHGEEGGETARAQMASLDPDALPLVREALEEFTVAPEVRMKTALRHALRGIATARGEDPATIMPE